MSGVYGEIDSRVDFFRVLSEARSIARQLLNRQPRNNIIESIDTQLDAMDRWTQNGRAPSQSERESIRVGILAVRELDDERHDESGRLAKLLYCLDSYFKAWPSDDEAANAQDLLRKKYGFE